MQPNVVLYCICEALEVQKYCHVRGHILMRDNIQMESQSLA